MPFTLPRDKIKDMVEIVYNRNCVYQTAYHVIWCPKYRKRILKEALQKYPEQSFVQKFGLCNRQKFSGRKIKEGF